MALRAFRLTLSLLAITSVGALPLPARADKVLVFQNQDGLTGEDAGDQAAPEATAYLKALGHDVTMIASLTPTLPADLSAFDAIWAMQVIAFTGVQQTAFADYVNQGGGLYISGERRPCCEGVNQSIQYIHNRLVPDITNFVNQQESGDDFVRATDTFGLTTRPNDLPVFKGGAAGAIGKDLPARNQVYKTVGSDTFVTGAWVGEDLTNGGGCLIVHMDISFWFDFIHPEQDKSKLVENFEHFLTTCNDRDHDGVSDDGEVGAGTDPDDPDSDDDSLCDGYGTVTGVCTSGESIHADSDSDGDIDPLDPDDDNDSLSTRYEAGAERAKPKADNDTKPAWLDLDSDNNNILDKEEGQADFDGDGIPAIVDLGDDPENCDTDEDCKVQGPTLVCNVEIGWCRFPIGEDGGIAGAGGSGGAASASGGGATDPDAGDGGEGDGGEGDGGRGSTASGGRSSGGRASSSGGDEAGDGGPDPRRRASSDGGCNCSVPSRSGAMSPLLGFAALALFGARRLRRRRSPSGATTTATVSTSPVSPTGPTTRRW